MPPTGATVDFTFILVVAVGIHSDGLATDVVVGTFPWTAADTPFGHGRAAV